MSPAKPASLRRLNIHYTLLQVGFWSMFAGICAYQATLLQSRGFSTGEVGLIMALRCLAGVFCQPLLGGFADRHPKIPLKVIVALSLFVSFFAGLALFLPMGLPGTVLLFLILGGFEISAYPLMDAMAVQFISEGVPIRYSMGRGIGSLAYALTCLFLGAQVMALGIESTLFTHSALVVAELLLVVTFPAFRAPARPPNVTAEPPHSALTLLRSNPRFALTLGGVLVGITAVLPLSNFLINILVSRGGGAEHLGLALFLMAAFELPAAMLFPRLNRRYGSARLLVLSMVFCALKALLLLLSGNIFLVMMAQPLQMLGYGLFTPVSVYFVNETVPPGDRVLGQTMMMVASNGLGGVFSGILAGQLLLFGGVNTMLVVLVLGGAAAVALTAAALRLPSAKQKD